MDKDDGFILGNHVRRAVLQEVQAGESDIARIAKKHRIIRPQVDKAVAELVERDLLSQEGDTLTLTEHGGQVWDEVSKLAGSG